MIIVFLALSLSTVCLAGDSSTNTGEKEIECCSTCPATNSKSCNFSERQVKKDAPIKKKSNSKNNANASGATKT